MRRDSTFCAKSVRYNIFTNGAPYIVKNCVTYKNRGSWSCVAQNVDWKKIVGQKVCWPRPKFSAHAYWERVQDEKL